MWTKLAVVAGLVAGLLLGGALTWAQDTLISGGLIITGAGSAVDLPDNSVDEADLNIGNAPSDDFLLKWDATAGKLTWGEIGFYSADFREYTEFGSYLTCDADPNTSSPAFHVGHTGAIVTVMTSSVRRTINFDFGYFRNPATSTAAQSRVFLYDSSNRVSVLAAFNASRNTQTRLTGSFLTSTSGPFSFQIVQVGGVIGTVSTLICRDSASVTVTA